MYCVKCRKTMPDGEIKVETTKNGRFRAVSKCPECGVMRQKFISKKDAEQLGGGIIADLLGKVPIVGKIAGPMAKLVGLGADQKN